ncbi:hypothetical protein ACVWZA_002093 [Sphingomonas sp. UYAg733]
MIILLALALTQIHPPRPAATPRSTQPIRVIPRPGDIATDTVSPRLRIAMASCPAFPATIYSINGSRFPGRLIRGSMVTITGTGFGPRSDYSMATLWGAPPPFVAGQGGYIISFTTWTDTKLVGTVSNVNSTSYPFNMSNNAYLELQSSRNGKVVKCGIPGFAFGYDRGGGSHRPRG